MSDTATPVPSGTARGSGPREMALATILLQGLRLSLGRGRDWSTTLDDADFTEETRAMLTVDDDNAARTLSCDRYEFKEYASRVFEDMRREGFDAKSARFRTSLCDSTLVPLGPLGRSGSILFSTGDRRFIVKTIERREGRFLLKILKQYHHYIFKHPQSLITRLYGLWRLSIKLMGTSYKLRFLAMNSIFAPTPLPIAVCYDLKGSTVNRRAPTDVPVLKDMDLFDQGRSFGVPRDFRDRLLAQLDDDTTFLCSLGIMDYSLLVGVVNGQIPPFSFGHAEHNVLGNVIGTDAELEVIAGQPRSHTVTNPRTTHASTMAAMATEETRDYRSTTSPDIIAPDLIGLDIIRSGTTISGGSSRVASEASSTTDHSLPPSRATTLTDSAGSSIREESQFWRDPSRASSGATEAEPQRNTYLLGLIDFLQAYKTKQRAARAAKGGLLCQSWVRVVPPYKGGISTQPPAFYRQRFLDAMAQYFVGLDEDE